MELAAILVALNLLTMPVRGNLQVGFYKNSCSKAETIVRSAVESYFNKDPTIAPGLLRLHFHDCFVQVLLKMIHPTHLLLIYITQPNCHQSSKGIL